MSPEQWRRWPVASLSVFGSWLRGEQHAGSDLDLLVELDDSVDLFGCVELQDEIGGRLGPSVDLRPPNNTSSRLPGPVRACRICRRFC